MARKSGRWLKTIASVGSVFGAIHAFNTWVAGRSSDKGLIKTTQGHYWHWKDMQIFYTVHGTGEKKLLLLHDLDPCSSGYEWKYLAPKVSESYTIYVVDFPGFARSSKPADTYVCYTFAQFIASFIKEVIGESATICSSGLSGAASVLSALNDPDCCEELVLINPPDLDELRKTPDHAAYMHRVSLYMPVIGTFIYNMRYRKDSISSQLRETCGSAFVRDYPVMIEASYEASHYDHSKERYVCASLDGRLINWDIRRALTLITCPVTLICGGTSAAQQESSRKYKEYCKDARIFCLSGAEQKLHIQDAERIAPLLLEL